MKALRTRASAPAPLLAGALFLAALLGAPAAEPAERFTYNTLPGRSFDNSMTLQRSRMGLTNVNGIEYVAVTRSDLYGPSGNMRLGATNLSVGSPDLTKSTQRVTEARVYVDTGNLPIRAQQNPGTAADLAVGSLQITNARPSTAQSAFVDPQTRTSILIGTVIAPGRFCPKVSTVVQTPGVEIVRGP